MNVHQEEIDFANRQAQPIHQDVEEGLRIHAADAARFMETELWKELEQDTIPNGVPHPFFKEPAGFTIEQRLLFQLGQRSVINGIRQVVHAWQAQTQMEEDP